jgi:hypothetical protein
MQSTSQKFEPLPAAPTLRGGAPALWLASVGIGGLSAAVIYAAEPGLNWLLVAVAIVGAVLALERPRLAELRSRRYQALGLLLVLAGAVPVTANLVDEFRLLVGIVWLGAVATWLGAGESPSMGPGRLAGTPFLAPLKIASEAAAVIGGGVRTVASEASAPVLRGTLLAAVIVSLFIALLGQADPTLGALRDSVVDLVTHLEGIGRVAFFGFVALASLGFLHLGTRPRAAPAEYGGATRRHTDVERIIVLGSVALLFATFLLLQLSYLFGSEGIRPGSGVTLAQAVHRGFGEISIVVSLTAAILAVLERDALRGGRERWVRAAALIVLVECLVLLASAYYRVVVYEDAYGYTVFRLYVRLYVGVLAVVVLLLGYELLGALDVPRLCWRSAVTAILALAVTGYWNYSAWVVHANIVRFDRSGRIDACYLMDSGVNGLPELVHALPRLAAPDREALTNWIRDRGSSLLPEPRREYAWYEWNLRRAAARAAHRELVTHAP